VANTFIGRLEKLIPGISHLKILEIKRVRIFSSGWFFDLRMKNNEFRSQK